MANAKELFQRLDPQNPNEKNLLEEIMGIEGIGDNSFNIVEAPGGVSAVGDTWTYGKATDMTRQKGDTLYQNNRKLNFSKQSVNEIEDIVTKDKQNKIKEVCLNLFQSNSAVAAKNPYKCNGDEDSDKLVRLMTVLLYRYSNNSNWNYSMFHSNIELFEKCMQILDVLCGNTIHSWEMNLQELDDGIKTKTGRTNADAHKSVMDIGLGVIKDFGSSWMSGGADSVKLDTFKHYNENILNSWMLHDDYGPNIFLLFTALKNLNVEGYQLNNVFRIESAEEYFSVFNQRMGIPSSETFDINKYLGFKEWIVWVINICNSNSQLLNSNNKIYKNNNKVEAGKYKSFMRTSPNGIFNVNITGPGTPMNTFVAQTLGQVKYTIDAVGIPSRRNRIYTTSLPIFVGGGNSESDQNMTKRVGDITFEDIVNEVRGNTQHMEFIGGSYYRNNYQSVMLVSKLRKYYDTILQTLNAQNLQLDNESKSYMDKLLNDIQTIIIKAEDTLNNLSNWVKSNSLRKQVSGRNEISLASILKEYMSTMGNLRKSVGEYEKNINRIVVEVPVR